MLFFVTFFCQKICYFQLFFVILQREMKNNPKKEVKMKTKVMQLLKGNNGSHVVETEFETFEEAIESARFFINMGIPVATITE